MSQLEDYDFELCVERIKELFPDGYIGKLSELKSVISDPQWEQVTETLHKIGFLTYEEKEVRHSKMITKVKFYSWKDVSDQKLWDYHTKEMVRNCSTPYIWMQAIKKVMEGKGGSWVVKKGD